MSGEIAKDSSAPMVVENAEDVIKALNSLMFEETDEAGPEKCKALVTTGVKLRPKRAKICLTLTDYAEQFANKEFSIFSEPIEVAGFQWKLEAHGEDGFLGLCLHLCPPEHFKGRFEFDVFKSFRLFNVFPNKDINIQCKTDKFKHDDPPYEWGIPDVIEIKKLLDPANEFVQADGSIQLEIHFAVVDSATLDHLLPADGKENGDKTGAN